MNVFPCHFFAADAHNDSIQSFEWNRDGSQVLSTSRDRCVHSCLLDTGADSVMSLHYSRTFAHVSFSSVFSSGFFVVVVKTTDAVQDQNKGQGVLRFVQNGSIV